MVRYKMVGRDVNSLPTQYRTWVVDDEPDYDGYYYTGLKSGPEPFIDVVGYCILDGYAIVDFNLPDPINWQGAYATMPQAVYNSQLAILDGYAYLFGSQSSDKIFKADINNPAAWWDTGATLPTTLCGSSLAIVDGYIYLFGGLGGVDEEATDTIFSAPVSDPLTWTNHGHLLPHELHKSSLAIVDGYIYLFGGQGINHAWEVIWKAPVSDPLSWTDTGATLPVAVYGSQIAIMNDTLFLLGGLFLDDAPTSNIYSASLLNPTSWSLAGNLPHPCAYGQFLTIGSQGYLYTQADIDGTQPYLTRIFKCKLTTPTEWSDTNKYIPGDVSQSQFAIIYDRIFAFGGNGISQVFSCNQILKYIPLNPKAVAYGEVTRTQYDAIVDPFLKTQLLGFPYWKTDYDD